jgi:hypothetical protein
MKRRRSEWPPTPPEQLDALASVSESDKERAREAARGDCSPRLRAMLDAESVKPTKGRRKRVLAPA